MASGDPAVGALQRYTGTIATETRRCGDIVQNLLSFARMSGAQMVPAHVHEQVEASLALVQHHLDLNNIHVERQLAAGDDQVICAPGEIRQALLAILVNAGEAMPTGGRLLVSTTLGSQEVRIAVTDSGPGIPPEVLPHIFEPFFTTKSEAKGVGLGLAVAYGIMQRHGGRVDVRSKPDAGSTFTLVWPRRPAPVGASPGAAVGADAGGSP
jgi:two-component system NtrC family sensor kinase